MNKLIRSFVVLLAMASGWLQGMNALAGVEPEFEQSVTGAGIAIGNNVVNYDQQFYNLAGNLLPTTPPEQNPANWNLVACNNTISLVINQQTINDCQYSSFTASVTISITAKDENGNTLPVQTRTLQVDYDNTLGAQYYEKHSFTFKGGYWTNVSITAVTGATYTPYLILKNTIGIERYWDINTTTIPQFSYITQITDENLIEVSWLSIQGAEWYNLEWTWVDNVDASGTVLQTSAIPFTFRHNATRVNITGTSYKLTPAYDKGFLLFRVRAVGLTGGQFTHPVEGAWSSANYGNFIYDAVASASFTIGNDAIELTEGTPSGPGLISVFEKDLTWQYASAFAEGGKRKEVISYYDGSLRNRQSVTRLNDANVSLIGEQVYDHQGRPAVSILPVPDPDATRTEKFGNKLEYHGDFNLANTTSEPYTKTDFDTDNGQCDRDIDILKSSSGAGLYYSVNNPRVGDMHYEYIPASAGYPFVVTEFTPDPTGRLRRQGGLGPDHKLDSDHETKYFYGVPEQDELDRLFGTSVGYKNHYEKNMVVDPNGQVSVSYLDASGRVIATGLAGNTPSNVEALSNQGSAVSLTTDLLSEGDMVMREDGTVMSKTFTVAKQGNYVFNYSIDVPRFTDASQATLCFDCVYDLVISLIDDCGNQLFDGDPQTAGNQPIVRTVGKVQTDFDTDCEAGGLSYSFTGDNDLSNQAITINLPVGSYTVSKSLVINRRAVDVYAEYFVDGNTSLKTEEDFRTWYLNNIDDSKCEQTCSTCMEDLGTLEGFLTANINRLLDEGVTPDLADTQHLNSLYADLLEHCEELCDGGTASCEVAYEMLIADVTPGGQYAQFELDYDPGNDDFDDLLDQATGGALKFNYQYEWLGSSTKDIEYKDGQGNWITVELDGQSYKPNELSQRDFIHYFEREWAEVLVKFHPEFCKYEFCIANEASERYTQNMLKVNNYQEALDSGFLNPTNDPNITQFNLGRQDPFWIGSGSSSLSAMRTLMNEYKEPEDLCDELSMWELPVSVYICSDHNDCPNLESCISSNFWLSTECEPYLDLMWQMFRATYIAEKNAIKEALSAYNCERTASMTGKEKRFYTQADALALVDYPTNIPLIKDQLNTEVADHCNTMCDAQADYWMLKLEGCSLSSTDADAIRADLVDVCKRGCDEDNPMGSSTVSPDNYDANEYNSFQEVFNAYALAGKLSLVTGICDINLIISPKRYGHNYTAVEADTSCVEMNDPGDDCVKLEENPELRDALMAVAGSTDTSCKKCVDCDRVWEAVDHLLSLYNNEFSDSTLELKQIAANVINDYLDFNLSHVDYENFVLKCVSLDPQADWKLEPLLYFYDNHPYGTAGILNLPTPMGPEMLDPLYETIQGKKMLWAASDREEQYLFASINEVLGVGPPPDTVPLTPCKCNWLEEQFKIYVAGAGNPTDTAAFNSFVSDGCWETASYGVFDFMYILGKCREVFEMDGAMLKDTSTWSSTKKGILANIAIVEVLELPDCFPCSDPNPYKDNGFFKGRQYNHKVYTGGTGEQPGNQPPPPHIVGCDSFLMFLDSMDALIGFSGMKNDLYSYLYTRDGSLLDETMLTVFMDAFYARFPNADKDTTTRTQIEEVLSFLYDYINCLMPASAPTNGCCMNTSIYARRLENMLDAMTEAQGPLGNKLVYDGWDAYPFLDDYYKSPLYDNKPCSTSINYEIEKFRMPTLEFSLIDSCGDTSTLNLNYISNLDNQAYFGRIIRFYDLKPVSIINCDTNVHYFNVKVEQLRWDGTLAVTTLTGYAPAWKLLDTCKTDTLILCDEDLIQHIPYKNRCREKLEILAEYQASRAYNLYIDSVKHDFRQRYMDKCREAFLDESFTMTRDLFEYQYTLYYYDQAGNLVQTVPPAGVNVISGASNIAQVHLDRINDITNLPTHSLESQYEYNTLNQLVIQRTPDGGQSTFWYDNLGRLVISQNEKQLNNPVHNPGANPAYSYSRYDALGRIIEVGQLLNGANMDWNVAFNPTSLANFISNASARQEVTYTYYDNDVFSISYKNFSQDNLRSRVVSSTYEDVHDNDDQTYEHAVHYSYDIHGNVHRMVRENSSLLSISHGYKIIEYDYDLISGNVNQVTYQRHDSDQFIHRYQYDADNRLTKALTSSNGLHWDIEAEYFYYLHGPLMRTEIGELKVQGVDYAYTLQGWLKGVNSNTLIATRDIGKDGDPGSANAYLAKDVVGFSLGYYDGDYTDIGGVTGTSHFLLATTSTDFGTHVPDLFNGNIRHMVTAIKPLLGSGGEPQGMTYQYDQLNRLVQADAWDAADVPNNTWVGGGMSSPLPDYHCEYTYDPNGNITTLRRDGSNASGLPMDNLTYYYNTGTNQLDRVTDAVGAGAYAIDIDGQSSGNYAYDELGNLTQDLAEQIATIEWTVYGKIKSITRTISSTKPDLEFEYSPDGHRTMKKVTWPSGRIVETYYIRDASGNIMSVYTQNPDSFIWSEAPIYGSSRIGVYNPEKVLLINGSPVGGSLPKDEKEHIRGYKRYELSNHLGNVLAVVSDKRTLICVGGNQYYEAEVITASDYYPFGMIMPDRTYSSGAGGYRFGFNGMEKDEEVKGDANSYTTEFRQLDVRLGRWLSVDPSFKKFAGESHYNAFANNPTYNIDPTGLEPDDPIYGFRAERKMRKFERKLFRMARRTGNAVYSRANFDAMDQEYHSKRWYWVKEQHKKNNADVKAGDNNLSRVYMISEIYEFRNWNIISPTRPQVAVITPGNTYNLNFVPPAGANPNQTFNIPADGTNTAQITATSPTGTTVAPDQASITFGLAPVGVGNIRNPRDGVATGNVAIPATRQFTLNYTVNPANAAVGPGGLVNWRAVIMRVTVTTFTVTMTPPPIPFPKGYTYENGRGGFRDFLKTPLQNKF